ncbi:MAG: SdrD B-like domain-containing protein [Chloroflexota bacterium]
MAFSLGAARVYRSTANDARLSRQNHLHQTISQLRLILFLLAIVVALLPFHFSFAAPLQQGTDPNPGIDLCYNADGPGRDISGTINGRPFTNHARIFRLTVDGVEQDAFCTDLYNPIGTKQCHSNSQIGVTDPKVACVLQYYPPSSITEDDEAAAVQSAIWHFSDGFELSPTESIFGRYQSIIADVETKFAGGACTPIDNWQLIADADTHVHFLQFESGQFLPDEHRIPIKVLAGDQPVANQLVNVTTDLGTLTWNGQSGQQLTVQTDGAGVATVLVVHDNPGVATIDISTNVELPVGTRIDPGANVQKLVVSGTDSYPLQRQISVQWAAGETLILKKFHDRNNDTLFNGFDEFIDWSVQICEAGTDNCFTKDLGPDGSESLSVGANQRYDICEVTNNDWLNTRPLCEYDVSVPATVWFSNVQLPALVIEKYHDLNGDGIRDDNEPEIEGWPFQILRQNGEEWVSTYSGNTGAGGRLGYSGIGFHTYQVKERFPSDEQWYASTAESQTVAVHDKQIYSLTFGNLKPAALTIDKTWLIDSNETAPPIDTLATACVRRTGPGTPDTSIVPQVQGVDLVADDDGFYCYNQLSTSVTFENLWPGTYELIERSPQNWTPVVTPAQVNLLSGSHFRSIGFVNSTTTASIGDFVWLDWNENGLQDSGESGVGGVTVHLLDGQGTEIASTSTDNSGQYIFQNLLPGGYSLRFEPPADHEISPQNQGNDTLIDSDIDPDTGATIVTTLSPGEADMSWDAGIFKPASPDYTFEKYINGNDADTVAEAVRTAPDQLLTFKYEVTNTGDRALIWTQLVDDVFGDLTAECGLPVDVPLDRSVSCSINRLSGAFPNGKVNIGQVSVRTQIQQLEDKNDPAWYITIVEPRELPASLGDTVWLDENENGLQDENEQGVPNVEVRLLAEDETPLSVTGTDSDGKYLFDDLAPGKYIVEFEIPYGYTLTHAYVGNDQAIDSNAQLTAPYVGRSESVTLQSGEANMTIDAGLVWAPPVLNIQKVPAINLARPGALITYTITYSNSGGSDAINVKIKEDIPQNTSVDLNRSTPGWQCESLGICTFTIGRLPAQTLNPEPLLFIVRVDDPLPTGVLQIANVVTINDEESPPNGPVGSSTPNVIVPVEPPTNLPFDNEPDERNMEPVLYLPFIG